MDTIKRTKRNLIIFTIVVVLSGWIGRLVDIIMGNPKSESLGMTLWLVAPLLTALILRGFFKDGWSDIGLKLNFKKNKIWYLVSLLIFPFVTIISLLIAGIIGLIDTSNFSLEIFLPMFIGTLVISFFKNIFEELAWQGYLTPKLLMFKLNDYLLYLIIGLVWATWHIPYYLYFLDRATFESFSSLSLPVFIILSYIIMLVWSITFTELRRITDSVWPVVLVHAVEDAFNVIFIYGYILLKVEFVFSPIYGVLGILLHLAIGLSIRNARIRKESI